MKFATSQARRLSEDESAPFRPAAGGRSSDHVRRTLEEMRTQPRQPGEASFFWYETRFERIAVKVLPGEYSVGGGDTLIATTLGSCIAVCLWDRELRLGGLNHFMLPDGDQGSGRYGAYAMELLLNEMMKRGAERARLQAKIFGGARVIAGMGTLNVGERNTRFVQRYLATEHIPVVGEDVLDTCPRKVCFFPDSGKAMVKRLGASVDTKALWRQERAAAQRAVSSATGSVELF